MEMISNRMLFFGLLMLYDLHFIIHVIYFYSHKPADDLTYQPFAGYPQHRLPLEHNIFLIYIHALCVIPLFLGSLQFMPKVRTMSMTLHRTVGYIYVTVYSVGAVGVIYFTPSMHCSTALKVAIGLLGVAWGGAGVLAFIAARNKQISLHRQWMARSFLYSHSIPLLFRLIWILMVRLGQMEELNAFEMGGWVLAVVTLPLGEWMARLEDPAQYLFLLSPKQTFSPKQKSN